MLIKCGKAAVMLYLAAAVAVLCNGVRPAWGAVIYSYVTDASSYEAPPASPYGTMLPVNIYLQETLTDGSSSFISADGGLFSAGAAVNELAVTGGTASQIPSNTSSAFVFTMEGEQRVYTNQPTNANNLEFYETIGGAGIQGPLMPDASGRILLGTLNVLVGTGQTTFRLTSLYDDTIDGSNSELGQNDGNTITVHGDDLDVSEPGRYTGANDAPAATFTVGLAPVPEPTSLAVFVAGAAGILARRRRDR